MFRKHLLVLAAKGGTFGAKCSPVREPDTLCLCRQGIVVCFSSERQTNPGHTGEFSSSVSRIWNLSHVHAPHPTFDEHMWCGVDAVHDRRLRQGANRERRGAGWFERTGAQLTFGGNPPPCVEMARRCLSLLPQTSRSIQVRSALRRALLPTRVHTELAGRDKSSLPYLRQLQVGR